MKITPARTSLAILLLLFVLPAASQASPVTLNFVGSVSVVGDPFGLVGSLVAPGDPVLVSLRYDTATIDGNPDPTDGEYLSSGWLKIDIDGLLFEQTSGVQLDVLHHGNGDQELFQALVCCGASGTFGAPTAWPGALPLFPYYRLGFGIGQNQLPYTLLSSDALPTSIDLALADFANGGVVSGTSDRSMYEIQFQLTQVPEPASFVLLGTGLVLGLVRSRRSR